jgi:acyl dehydratase
MAQTIKRTEFARLAGKELEPSDWLDITQERINQFADATNDHQFIHTEPEKALHTPFGGTIAHGYLTLSLLSYLLAQNTVRPEGMAMALNYGSDKVRYLAPVKVGQRIRARQRIVEIAEKRPGQWLCKIAVTVEIDGESVPALIAEILTMYIAKQDK